ncbi:hypothetical protein CHUAL_014055 [Chamberlinius hualienensis]
MQRIIQHNFSILKMFILFVLSVLLFSISTLEAAALGTKPIQLKVNGEIIELMKSDNSWLKMVLVFGQNRPKVNCTEDTITMTEITTEAPTITTVIPTDFIKFGSKYYYLGDKYLNWQESFDACKKKGTKLAYPLNAEENKDILSFISTEDKGGDSYKWWFGGMKNSEGVWVWSHDNSTVKYNDWSEIQPKDDDSGVCMNLLVFDKKWYGNPCSYQYRFVCQL